MLSKDVCKRCYVTEQKRISGCPFIWGSTEESHWGEGFVICPSRDTRDPIYAYVKLPTPNSCFYKLEQTLAAQPVS